MLGRLPQYCEEVEQPFCLAAGDSRAPMRGIVDMRANAIVEDLDEGAYERAVAFDPAVA